MASESKPMDIEEEVEDIDQEIKKPDEGQVAEREWNFRRQAETEDLTAPDVFARFRKETLPIFSESLDRLKSFPLASFSFRRAISFSISRDLLSSVFIRLTSSSG